jgi:hypothetical protein
VGRQPVAAKNGPCFIRVRDSAGKYQWVKHDTELAAEKAAKAAPFARHAQELGLTVDDLTIEANNKPAFSMHGDGGSIRNFNVSFVAALELVGVDLIWYEPATERATISQQVQ